MEFFKSLLTILFKDKESQFYEFLLMIFIIKMGMFISLILKVYGQSLIVF